MILTVEEVEINKASSNMESVRLQDIFFTCIIFFSDWYSWKPNKKKRKKRKLETKYVGDYFFFYNRLRTHVQNSNLVSTYRGFIEEEEEKGSFFKKYHETFLFFSFFFYENFSIDIVSCVSFVNFFFFFFFLSLPLLLFVLDTI